MKDYKELSSVLNEPTNTQQQYRKTIQNIFSACPALFKVANGAVQFRNVTNVYYDIVAVSCNSGYQLRGSGLITCLGDGSWNSDSSCTVAGMY